MLYIRPKAILTPDRRIERHAVLVEGERIIAIAPADVLPPPLGATELPAGDLLLAPGFIDLQINGAFGCDFTERPDSIWEVAAHLPRYGVTSFLPTVISSPCGTVEAACEVLREGPPPGFEGSSPLGLHLEGPFLNPAKCGAHNPEYLRTPDLDVVCEWSPENGVRLVTLAPELPGAREVARVLVERGVVVSAGHSMATFEEAHAGIEAGIGYGTHLFNAMPPFEHREPGLGGALLTDPGVTVGVIADGVHLHPGIVQFAWQAKGPHRFSLVSDAMSALGMPPGTYRLGDFEVITDGTSARLADSRLAGSLLSLDQAVRNLVEFTGCSIEQAIATVTTVPATVLRLCASRGRIAPRYVADMVLLTHNLQVVATVAAGRVVYTDL